MNDTISEHAMQEVSFTDLNSEGEGVGRLEDGRVVMVGRALPGDRATVRLRATSNAKVARGEVAEMLASSPNRKEHLCPHYAEGCPASPLGVLKSKAALDWKVAHLKETLRRVGGKTVEPRACIPSPIGWRYRDRVELAIGLEDGLWKIGYRKGSGVVAISNCLLADDRIGRSIKLLAPLLMKYGAKQKAETHEGAVLRLRVGDTGGVVGVLYISTLDPVLDFWKRWLRQGDLAGWEVRKVESMEARHGVSTLLSHEGSRTFVIAAGDAKITLPAGAFTQANQSLRKKLVEEVIGSIPGRGRLLDLYGGYGAFGFEWVRSGGSCLVVDSDRDSIEAGRKAVGERSIKFVLGNLNNPRTLAGVGGDVDAVIADPPYVGLSKSVLDWLQKHGPGLFIYLSCHPAALARDLKGLTGYKIESVQPVDMFPQTPDLETVVVMRRG